MEIIKVILIDLPVTVDGTVKYTLDDNGLPFYIILINSRLSVDRQSEAYFHEVEHIDSRDFDKMQYVDRLEFYRHMKSNFDVELAI